MLRIRTHAKTTTTKVNVDAFGACYRKPTILVRNMGNALGELANRPSPTDETLIKLRGKFGSKAEASRKPSLRRVPPRNLVSN